MARGTSASPSRVVIGRAPPVRALPGRGPAVTFRTKPLRAGRHNSAAKLPIRQEGAKRPIDNKRREDYEHYKALGMLWRYFQIWPDG